MRKIGISAAQGPKKEKNSIFCKSILGTPTFFLALRAILGPTTIFFLALRAILGETTFLRALREILGTTTVCFFLALRECLGTTTLFTLNALNRTDSRGEARSAFTHFA